MKYRMLKPGEVIREGDEYMGNKKLLPSNRPHTWEKNSPVWIGRIVGEDTFIHRRPLKRKVAARPSKRRDVPSLHCGQRLAKNRRVVPPSKRQTDNTSKSAIARKPKTKSRNGRP